MPLNEHFPVYKNMYQRKGGGQTGFANEYLKVKMMFIQKYVNLRRFVFCNAPSIYKRAYYSWWLSTRFYSQTIRVAFVTVLFGFGVLDQSI